MLSGAFAEVVDEHRTARESAATRAEYLQNVFRARRQAAAGDVAMLAGLFVPEVLSGAGAAMGGERAGAEALAQGTALPAQATEPGAVAPRVPFGQRLSNLGASLGRTHRLATARTVGSLFGAPSPEVTGSASLIEDIMQRRRQGREERDLLMRADDARRRGDVDEVERLLRGSTIGGIRGGR